MRTRNPCWSSSPEYKREQRRLAAEREGRADYKPRGDREAQHIAHLARIAAKAEPKPKRDADEIKRTARQKANDATRLRDAADPERNKERRRQKRRLMTAQQDGTLDRRDWTEHLTRMSSCAYCGVAMTRTGPQGGGLPTDATVDHIMPVSRGGAHSVYNITVCCLSCNSAKGNRTLAEWQAALPPWRHAIIASVVPPGLA